MSPEAGAIVLFKHSIPKLILARFCKMDIYINGDHGRLWNRPIKDTDSPLLLHAQVPCVGKERVCRIIIELI